MCDAGEGRMEVTNFDEAQNSKGKTVVECDELRVCFSGFQGCLKLGE